MCPQKNRRQAGRALFAGLHQVGAHYTYVRRLSTSTLAALFFLVSPVLALDTHLSFWTTVGSLFYVRREREQTLYEYQRWRADFFSFPLIFFSSHNADCSGGHSLRRAREVCSFLTSCHLLAIRVGDALLFFSKCLHLVHSVDVFIISVALLVHT